MHMGHCTPVWMQRYGAMLHTPSRALLMVGRRRQYQVEHHGCGKSSGVRRTASSYLEAPAGLFYSQQVPTEPCQMLHHAGVEVTTCLEVPLCLRGGFRPRDITRRQSASMDQADIGGTWNT